MLKKGSNNTIVDGSTGGGGGGDGVAVASSSILDVGFSLDGFALPGTSTAHTTNNNNILDMNKFVVLGGSSIGDPISSSFKPQLHDMELHRRARNNAILAKIQELEANACVQAARSERLRMMREEYESLVRRYASARKSHWGAGASSTNGYFNENNNGFPPNRYLQPFSPQQPPYISLKEPGPPPLAPPSSQPQLLTTTNTHPFIPTIYTPTRDSPAGNINRSYVTTGVNTEITGPVKSTVASSQDNNDDDLQVTHKRGKVTDIIKDSGSQTIQTIDSILPPVEKMRAQVDPETALFHQQNIQSQVATGLLLRSSSSTAPVPPISGTTTTQDAIVMDRDDGKGSLLKPKKSISTKVDMMMMMLDEEDDESSCQAEELRKQRVENLHQQLKQPKAKYRDDSNSISSSPSTPVGMEFASTSNNTTEEASFKQRQKQKQQQHHHLEKMAAEHGNKYQKMRNHRNNDEREDETSQDTLTISFANNNNNNRESSTGGGAGRERLSKIASHQQDHDDITLSDSTSAFHTENHQNQRKKLLEQLATASSTNKGSSTKNLRSDTGYFTGNKDLLRNSHVDDNSSAEDDDEERDIVKSEEKKDEATSESIGDSMMDSIQKTPDLLLPRDDLELQEIAEVNEREHGGELEEIELALKLSPGSGDLAGKGSSSNVASRVDDVLMVPATAVTADTKSPRGSSGISGTKSIQAHSGVNDMVSVERKMGLKQDSSMEQDGIKEFERAHQVQINDIKEIRPNNLSSSKVEVAAAEKEENNFTHANNNPGESNSGITTNTTFQETPVAAVHSQENKNSGDGFYEDVHEKVEFQNSPFCEQDNMNGDGKGVNESSKKILHSPAASANVSAHSSNTSSFSSVSNAEVEGNGEINNRALIPPSSIIPPTTNLHTHYPAESSSSSSGQQSLEDQVSRDIIEASANNNISQTKERSNSGSHQDTPQQAQQERNHDSSPTLPRSIHKRHQLLEEQVNRKKKENEPLPPVGADVMPERLTTSSDSSSAPVLEPRTEPAANKPDVDINNGTKTIPTEKGATSVKTTKGSIPTAFSVSPATALSPSSSKKVSGNANNSVGSAGNGNGTGGGGGGMTSIRPASGNRSSKMSSKQGPGSNVTVPSGPTGAQNTARRVRLKLHEDSDTDSSEIGSVKSQAPTSAKGSFSGSKGNATTSNKPSSINTSKSSSDGREPQKSNSVDVDDDFDDFYDNF